MFVHLPFAGKSRIRLKHHVNRYQYGIAYLQAFWNTRTSCYNALLHRLAAQGHRTLGVGKRLAYRIIRVE
jgi:hypothetical protein